MNSIKNPEQNSPGAAMSNIRSQSVVRCHLQCLTICFFNSKHVHLRAICRENRACNSSRIVQLQNNLGQDATQYCTRQIRIKLTFMQLYTASLLIYLQKSICYRRVSYVQTLRKSIMSVNPCMLAQKNDCETVCHAAYRIPSCCK